MGKIKNIFINDELAGAKAGEQIIDINGEVRVFGESAFASLEDAIVKLEGEALVCSVQSGKYSYFKVGANASVAPVSQVIYVNFNGAEGLAYENSAGYVVNDVTVDAPLYSDAQKAQIIESLNANAAAGVVYVDSAPAGGEYSTIHVGATTAFDTLGNFKGLSETIDVGNLIKDDNAFVNTNNIKDIDDLINTIEHEADHLTGGEHDVTDGTINDFANPVVIYLDPENTVIGMNPVSVGGNFGVNKEITMKASDNGYSIVVEAGNEYPGVIGGSILTSSTTVDDLIANKTSVEITGGTVTNQDLTKYLNIGGTLYVAGPYVGLNVVGGHVDLTGGHITLPKMESTTVNISGGSIYSSEANKKSYIVGGVAKGNSGTMDIADTYVTITGGTINAHVVGGSFVPEPDSNPEVHARVDRTHVTIGGTADITGNIYAGAANGGLTFSSMDIGVGTANFAMNGGTVTGDIFGGSKSGVVTEASMTFSGGTIVGNIYAGGEGYPDTDGELGTSQEVVRNPDGSLTVVVGLGPASNNDNRLSYTGSSSITMINNVDITGMVYGMSKGGRIPGNAEYIHGYVGNSVLNFGTAQDAYTGDFKAGAKGFDEINILNANMTVKASAGIFGGDVITISSGSSLNVESGTHIAYSTNIINNGSLNFTVSASELAAPYFIKLIDYIGSETPVDYANLNVTVNGAVSDKLLVYGNDLYLSNISLDTFYVDPTLNPETAASRGLIYGVNAFSDMTSASAKAHDGVKINIATGKYVEYSDLNAVRTDITVASGAEVASSDADWAAFEIGANSTVTNNGTIGYVSGDTPTQTQWGIFSSNANITVTNNAGGLIKATNAIRAAGSGVITLKNYGTIEGRVWGGGGMDVENWGTISSSETGALFSGVSTIKNHKDGVLDGLASNSSGIRLVLNTNKQATIINDGTVRANYSAINTQTVALADCTLNELINQTHIINNTGSIYGAANGIEGWNANYTLNNSGSITGEDSGIYTQFCSINGTTLFWGFGIFDITNTGTIYGNNYSIYNLDLTYVDNSNTIGIKDTSKSKYGIYSYRGEMNITNRAGGVIAGTDYALYAGYSSVQLNIPTSTLVLANDGLIDGNVYGRDIDISGNGTINGNITAVTNASKNGTLVFSGNYSATAVQKINGNLSSTGVIRFDGGTITLDAANTITAASINITIDAAALTNDQFSYTLANISQAQADAIFAMNITLTCGELVANMVGGAYFIINDTASGNKYYFALGYENGVLSLKTSDPIHPDNSPIAVNSAWASLPDGSFVDVNGVKYIVGTNAFATTTAAAAKMTEGVEALIMASDSAYTPFTIGADVNNATITNNGTIQAATPYSDYAINFATAAADRGVAVYTIVNNGSIVGIVGEGNGQAITLDVTNNLGANMDEVVASWVNLTNHGDMYAEGDLVTVYETGTIVNTGTMRATRAVFYTPYGSNKNMTITNSGLIEGDTWVYFKFSNFGPDLAESMVVNNLAGGVMAGGGGLSLSIGGYVTVNNDGDFIAHGTGVNGVGYGTWGQMLYLTLNNTGTFFGKHISSLITDYGNVTNSGVIGRYTGSYSNNETWTSVGGVVSGGSLKLENKSGGSIYGSNVAVQAVTLDMTNDGLIDGGIYVSLSADIKGSGTIKGGITAENATPANAIIRFTSGNMTVSGDVTSTGTISFEGATVTFAGNDAISSANLNITIDSSALTNVNYSYTFANVSQAQAAAFMGMNITLTCGDIVANAGAGYTFKLTSGGVNYYFALEYANGSLTINRVTPVIDEPNPVQINNAWIGKINGSFVDANGNKYILGENAFGSFDSAVSTRPSDITDFSVMGVATVNGNITLQDTANNTLNLLGGAVITIGKDASGNLYSLANLDKITGTGTIILNKDGANVGAWLGSIAKDANVSIIVTNANTTPDASGNVNVITGNETGTDNKVISADIDTVGDVTLNNNDGKELIIAGSVNAGGGVDIINSQASELLVIGDVSGSKVNITTSNDATASTIVLNGTVTSTGDLAISNAGKGVINGGINADGSENAAVINASGNVTVSNDGHLNANITTTGAMTFTQNTSRRTLIGDYTASSFGLEFALTGGNTGIVGDESGAQWTTFTATGGNGHINATNNNGNATDLPGLFINTTFTAPGNVTLTGGIFHNVKVSTSANLYITNVTSGIDTTYTTPVVLRGDSSAASIFLEATTDAAWTQDIVIKGVGSDTLLASDTLKIITVGLGTSNLILDGYVGTIAAPVIGDLGTFTIGSGSNVEFKMGTQGMLTADALVIENGATAAFDSANPIYAINKAMNGAMAVSGSGTMEFSGKDINAGGGKGFFLSDPTGAGFDMTGFTGTAKVMADSILELEYDKDYFGNAATVDVASTGTLALNKGGNADMKLAGAGNVEVNKTGSFTNDNSAFTGKVVLGTAADLGINGTGSSSTTILLGASEIDMTATGVNVLDLNSDQLFEGAIKGTAEDKINVKANVALTGTMDGFTGDISVLESGATLSIEKSIAAAKIDMGDNTNANSVALNASQTFAGAITGGSDDTLKVGGALKLTGDISAFAGAVEAKTAGASIDFGVATIAKSIDLGNDAVANTATFSADQNYAGTITGGADDTIAVESALTLSGDNSTFAGSADVSKAGAALTLTNSFGASSINLGNDATANTLVLNNAGGTFASAVTGAAADNVSAVENATLSGDLSGFAGDYTVAAGKTLSFTGTTAASLKLNGEGSYDIAAQAGVLSIASDASATKLTLNNNSAALASGTFGDISIATGTLTIASGVVNGAITGNGADSILDLTSTDSKTAFDTALTGLAVNVSADQKITITGAATNNDYIINLGSAVSSTPVLTVSSAFDAASTISVTANLDAFDTTHPYGTYTLAQFGSSFAGRTLDLTIGTTTVTISIADTLEGTITKQQSIMIGGKLYSFGAYYDASNKLYITSREAVTGDKIIVNSDWIGHADGEVIVWPQELTGYTYVIGSTAFGDLADAAGKLKGDATGSAKISIVAPPAGSAAVTYYDQPDGIMTVANGVTDFLLEGNATPEGTTFTSVNATVIDVEGLFAGEDVTAATKFTLKGLNVIGNIYGGNRAADKTESSTTSIINTTQTVYGSVFGGGKANQGASSLVLDGGIYRGAYVAGGAYGAFTTASTSVAITSANADVTLYSQVVGGSVGAATVNGDTSVSFTIGANKLVVANMIYGGNLGGGIVNGNTSVTFSGNAANLSFTSLVDGGIVSAGNTRSIVFKDFAGAKFNGILRNMDKVVISGNTELQFGRIQSAGAGLEFDISHRTLSTAMFTARTPLMWEFSNTITVSAASTTTGTYILATGYDFSNPSFNFTIAGNTNALLGMAYMDARGNSYTLSLGTDNSLVLDYINAGIVVDSNKLLISGFQDAADISDYLTAPVDTLVFNGGAVVTGTITADASVNPLYVNVASVGNVTLDTITADGKIIIDNRGHLEIGVINAADVEIVENTSFDTLKIGSINATNSIVAKNTGRYENVTFNSPSVTLNVSGDSIGTGVKVQNAATKYEINMNLDGRTETAGLLSFTNDSAALKNVNISLTMDATQGAGEYLLASNADYSTASFTINGTAITVNGSGVLLNGNEYYVLTGAAGNVTLTASMVGPFDTTTVMLNSTWAGLANGTPVVADNKVYVIGTNAFAGSNNAFNAVDENGTVKIDGTGTYAFSIPNSTKVIASLDIGSANVSYKAYNLGYAHNGNRAYVNNINVGTNGVFAIVGDGEAAPVVYDNMNFTSNDNTASLLFNAYGTTLSADNSGFTGTVSFKTSGRFTTADSAFANAVAIVNNTPVDASNYPHALIFAMGGEYTLSNVISGTGRFAAETGTTLVLNTSLANFNGLLGGAGGGVVIDGANAVYSDVVKTYGGSSLGYVEFRKQGTFTLNNNGATVYLCGNDQVTIAANSNDTYNDIYFGSHEATTMNDISLTLNSANVTGSTLGDFYMGGQNTTINNTTADGFAVKAIVDTKFGDFAGSGINNTINGNVSVTLNGNAVGKTASGIVSSKITGDVYVTLDGGTLSGTLAGVKNILGGSVGNVYIDVRDGSASDVVGLYLAKTEGEAYALDGDIIVTMSGGTVNQVRVAGSSAQQPPLLDNNTVNNASLTITGGSITDKVYGGSLTNVLGTITIGVSGTASVKDIFAGSKYADTANTVVNVSGGTVTGTIYGGGAGGTDALGYSTVGKSTINVSAGTVNGSIIGGGIDGDTTSTTEINITGGTVKGAVEGTGVTGDIKITVSSAAKVGNITGTHSAGAGNIVIDANTTATFIDGVNGAAATAQSVTINVGMTNMTQNFIRAIGHEGGHVTGDTKINILDGAVISSGNGDILVGGAYAGTGSVGGNSSIVIGTVGGAGATVGTSSARSNIVGGGGNIGGTSSVTINSGTVYASSIIGGTSWGTSTVSDSFVTINGGDISTNYTSAAKRAIYGGSYGTAQTTNSGKVTINGGTIDANIVGGNQSTQIASTEIVITGGTFKNTSTIYAGGLDAAAIVSGNATVTVSGGIFESGTTLNGTRDTVNGVSSLTLNGGTLNGAITSFDVVNVGVDINSTASWTNIGLVNILDGKTLAIRTPDSNINIDYDVTIGLNSNFILETNKNLFLNGHSMTLTNVKVGTAGTDMGTENGFLYGATESTTGDFALTMSGGYTEKFRGVFAGEKTTTHGNLTFNVTDGAQVGTGAIGSGSMSSADGFAGIYAVASNVTAGDIAVNVSGTGTLVGGMSNASDGLYLVTARSSYEMPAGDKGPSNVTVDSMKFTLSDGARIFGKSQDVNGKFMAAFVYSGSTVKSLNGLDITVDNATMGTIYAAGYVTGAGSNVTIEKGTALNAVSIAIANGATVGGIYIGGAQDNSSVIVNGKSLVTVNDSTTGALSGGYSASTGTVTLGDLEFVVNNSTVGQLLGIYSDAGSTSTLGNVSYTLTNSTSTGVQAYRAGAVEIASFSVTADATTVFNGNLDGGKDAVTGLSTLTLNGATVNGSISNFDVVNVSGITSINGGSITVGTGTFNAASGSTLNFDFSATQTADRRGIVFDGDATVTLQNFTMNYKGSTQVSTDYAISASGTGSTLTFAGGFDANSKIDMTLLSGSNSSWQTAISASNIVFNGDYAGSIVITNHTATYGADNGGMSGNVVVNGAFSGSIALDTVNGRNNRGISGNLTVTNGFSGSITINENGTVGNCAWGIDGSVNIKNGFSGTISTVRTKETAGNGNQSFGIGNNNGGDVIIDVITATGKIEGVYYGNGTNGWGIRGNYSGGTTRIFGGYEADGTTMKAMVNYGLISGRSLIAAGGIGGGGDITILVDNYGIIEAVNFSAGTPTARAISKGSDLGYVNVTNRAEGTIRAVHTDGVDGAVIALGEAFNIGGSNDTIANYGTIIGHVYMGGGDDVFTLGGGSITGNVNMGDGNDTFTVTGNATVSGNISNAENFTINSGATLTVGANSTWINNTITINGSVAIADGMTLTVEGVVDPAKFTLGTGSSLIYKDAAGNYVFTGASATVNTKLEGNGITLDNQALAAEAGMTVTDVAVKGSSALTIGADSAITNVTLDAAAELVLNVGENASVSGGGTDAIVVSGSTGTVTITNAGTLNATVTGNTITIVSNSSVNSLHGSYGDASTALFELQSNTGRVADVTITATTVNLSNEANGFYTNLTVSSTAMNLTLDLTGRTDAAIAAYAFADAATTNITTMAITVDAKDIIANGVYNAGTNKVQLTYALASNVDSTGTFTINGTAATIGSVVTIGGIDMLLANDGGALTLSSEFTPVKVDGGLVKDGTIYNNGKIYDTGYESFDAAVDAKESVLTVVSSGTATKSFAGTSIEIDKKSEMTVTAQRLAYASTGDMKAIVDGTIIMGNVNGASSTWTGSYRAIQVVGTLNMDSYNGTIIIAGANNQAGLYGENGGVDIDVFSGSISISNKDGGGAYGVRSYGANAVININTITSTANIYSYSAGGNTVFGIGAQQGTVKLGTIEAGAVIKAVSELSHTAAAVYGPKGVTIDAVNGALTGKAGQAAGYGVYAGYSGGVGYDIAIAKIGATGSINGIVTRTTTNGRYNAGGIVTAGNVYGTKVGETYTAMINDGTISAMAGATCAVSIRAGEVNPYYGDSTPIQGMGFVKIVNNGTISAVSGTEGDMVTESYFEGYPVALSVGIVANNGLDVVNNGVITATATDIGGGTQAYAIYGGAVNKLFAQGNTANAPMIQTYTNSAGTTWTFDAADTVANAGTIVGNVDLGYGNDTLSNLAGGEITGNVNMGAGDDTVKLSSLSQLTGDVVMGEGNDSLVITDFTAESGATLIKGALEDLENLKVTDKSGNEVELTSAGGRVEVADSLWAEAKVEVAEGGFDKLSIDLYVDSTSQIATKSITISEDLKNSDDLKGKLA